MTDSTSAFTVFAKGHGGRREHSMRAGVQGCEGLVEQGTQTGRFIKKGCLLKCVFSATFQQCQATKITPTAPLRCQGTWNGSPPAASSTAPVTTPQVLPSAKRCAPGSNKEPENLRTEFNRMPTASTSTASTFSTDPWLCTRLTKATFSRLLTAKGRHFNWLRESCLWPRRFPGKRHNSMRTVAVAENMTITINGEKYIFNHPGRQ